MLRNLTLLLSFSALCWVATAYGKTYRWVDENGVTVYSQSPPPEGEATVVKPPPPPATPPDEAWKKLNEQRLKLQDNREDRTEAKEKEQKQEVSEEIRRKNCEISRENLKQLEGLPPRLVRTSDGKYVPITEEDRQKRIKETRDQVKEFCD